MTIHKYVERPAEISAIQATYENLAEILHNFPHHEVAVTHGRLGFSLRIQYRDEEPVMVKEGDYILFNDSGLLTSMDPGAFEHTYMRSDKRLTFKNGD